jgi:hypothetical protein
VYLGVSHVAGEVKEELVDLVMEQVLEALSSPQNAVSEASGALGAKEVFDVGYGARRHCRLLLQRVKEFVGVREVRVGVLCVCV